MADRNRELVPDNWSLVRERALTLDFVRKDGILNTRVSAEERSQFQSRRDSNPTPQLLEHSHRLGYGLASLLYARYDDPKFL